MILDRAGAKKLAARVLKMSAAKDVVVHASGERRAHLRFANNEITSCGDVDDLSLTVHAAFGRRHGSATTNQLDDASLAAAVATAEDLARLSPEDPEFLPALGPSKLGEVRARDGGMAKLDAEARRQGVEACLRAALDQNVVAAGFFEARERFFAMASSAGAFGHHASTEAEFSATARTTDGTGSGWAAASSWHPDVDWAAIGRRAVDKAVRSMAPRRLDPGRYTVILEPEAAASMLGMVRFALHARSADEGRSFFSRPGGGNRIGEKLFADKITLLSDPFDARVPAAPFDGDGLALPRRTWIEKGVLKELVTTRYWAAQKGRTPTGQPPNLIMLGGDATVEQMIKSCDRGILVTRLWYVRMLDPRTLLLTGLTRDGTFWIEKGEIAYPVNNFRFNESPATVIANAEALSAPVRTSAGVLAPAIKTSGFHMASISAAV